MLEDGKRNVLGLRSTKKMSDDQFEVDSLLVKSLLSARPDKPCHKIRDSLFISSSGFIDYRGILNVCLILLVMANAHIALETFIKYGILFDPIKVLKILFYKPTESPSILILLGLNVFALSSLGIEVLLSKGIFNEKVGLAIITTLLTSQILIPAGLLFLADCHVLAAFIVMIIIISVFLKLVSYHITNFWCRETHASVRNVRQHSISPDTVKVKADTNLVHYPNNLNIKDLYYFLIAPTLCYELNFPRISCIRRKFLIKWVLEMIFFFHLNVCLIQQCITPTLNDSLKPIKEMDIPRILENLFKLSVPFMCVFFMSYYSFYHSYLNAVAEILRFGDRHFYCDFWNFESIMDYWQNWNICVHKWCLRHLYIPLRHCGFTDSQTSATVFFISAFLHEYIFIVSFKLFRFWSFLVMALQVPYFMFLDKHLYDHWTWIVGISFCNIAVSFCSIMYYNDYYSIN